MNSDNIDTKTKNNNDLTEAIRLLNSSGEDLADHTDTEIYDHIRHEIYGKRE